MNPRIALGQMDVVVGEVERNFAEVERLARAASADGADLLLLPELWSTGYCLERAEELASTLDSGPAARFAEIAATHRIALCGSILTRLPEGGIGNTALLIDREGRCQGRYSKIHLFGLMNEPDHLTPGRQPCRVEMQWGTLGLTICYDLRFPELFRAYALSGVDVILLVAQWPMPRLMHWQTLLRARAIENQCYVVACNRVGTSGTTTFFGHSTIIDPRGEILFEAGDAPVLHAETLDRSRVVSTREHMPVLSDRRQECYFLSEPEA